VGNANYKKRNMYFLTSNKNVIIATTKTDIKCTYLQNISLYVRFTFLTADSTKYALLGRKTAQFGRQAPKQWKNLLHPILQ